MEPKSPPPARRRRRLYESPEGDDLLGDLEAIRASRRPAPEPPAESPGSSARPEIPDDGEVAARRTAQARQTISRYVAIATGIGFVPIPLANSAAIAGTQLTMVADLSRIYEIEFSQSRGRALIAALVGVAGTRTVSAALLGAVALAVPPLAPAAVLLCFPAYNGAATYAIGRVFQHHFELGGTLLDFDPARTRAYFREQLTEGRRVVQRTDPGT